MDSLIEPNEVDIVIYVSHPPNPRLIPLTPIASRLFQCLDTTHSTRSFAAAYLIVSSTNLSIYYTDPDFLGADRRHIKLF
jgi:hypothetical protein